MADLNPETVERLERALSTLANTIDPVSNKLEDLGEAFEEQQKKNQKATADAIKGTANFAGKMADAKEGFTGLNPVIDLTAKLLGSVAGLLGPLAGTVKGIVEGGAEVVKFSLEQLQTAWNAYKQLSGTGLASSFEEMKRTADIAGLKYEDLSKVLQANSVDLANFGGTAAKGVKAFALTSEALKQSREQFRNLGIGMEEFAEFQLKYQAQETRLGRARALSTEDLAKQTEKYITELDQVTRLTGLSRKEQLNQRDKALSEVRFNAATRLLGKNVEEVALKLNSSLIAKGGEGIAEGFRASISGNYGSEAAKSFALMFGSVGDQLIRDVRSGKIKTENIPDAINSLIEKAKKDEEGIAGLAQYRDDSTLTKLYVELRKLGGAAKTTAEDVAASADAADASKKGQNEQTKALADAEDQVYKLGKNFQTLSTSSTAAASAVNVLAKTMNAAADKLKEISGETGAVGAGLTPEERNQRELTKAVKEQTEAQNRLAELQEKEAEQRKFQDLAKSGNAEQAEFAKKWLDQNGENFIQRKYRELQTANAENTIARSRSQIAGRTQIQERLQVPAEKSSKSGAYGDLIGSIKSAESIEGGDVDPALIESAKKLRGVLGREFGQFTAFNDLTHQQDKAEYATSQHRKGTAFDFTIKDPKSARDILKRLRAENLGLTFHDEYNGGSAGKDGAHIHAYLNNPTKRRFGGDVASGRQYLVGEDGPEVITSNTNGTVTPNSVFDGGFKMLADKMDKVAELLSDGNSTRKKQLQRTNA